MSTTAAGRVPLRRLGAIALASFMAVQLVVPTIGLFGPRPARFGWQMYSVSEAAPQAWGEAADGSLTPIDLADRLAVLRADSRDIAAIGAALCEESAYRAVLVQFSDEPRQRVACP